MAFQWQLLEEAYCFVKMTGPVTVRPASSDFWKVPLVWYMTQPASNCFKMHCKIHFIKSLELKRLGRLRIQQEVGCNWPAQLTSHKWEHQEPTSQQRNHMAGKQQSENNTSQNIIKLHKFMLVIEQFMVKNLSNQRNRQGRGRNLNKSKYHYITMIQQKINCLKKKKICLTKEIRRDGEGLNQLYSWQRFLQNTVNAYTQCKKMAAG